MITGTAEAAEPGQLLSSEINDKQIILYVQNPGELESVQCQIGSSMCQNITYETIDKQEVPVRTLLLLDNSLSIAQKYRPMIYSIMNDLAANRMHGEQITVATFSDKITYVLEDCSDYTQLKPAIDGITYQDQETYLTDVLYELLSQWNQEEDGGLRRIVIVSDGVDNKAIGYTKEELYGLLEKHTYPIYTIGCSQKNMNNSDELKNMFALSRMTLSDSWLLDDVKDSMEIVNGVAAGNQALRIVAPLPEEVCDGTSKGVKLSMTAGGSTMDVTVTADMPFGEVKPSETETEVETEAETEEIEETEVEEGSVIDEAEAQEQQKRKMLMWLIIAGFSALAAGAVIILIVRAVKAHKEATSFEPLPDNAVPPEGWTRWKPYSGNDTSAAGSDTGMVWGEAPAGMLILTDLNNTSRTFRAPLSVPVTIGRSQKQGCQIVLDYDKSVSHTHCQIRVVNGQVRVMDLGSKNGTILNGRKLVHETLLTSGSILTLGNLKMKVELR
ncbi:MAG: FHA domain-containing protein [Lachnospiraceae bacterium]|nr:FHA domain-containing protein [Lachnospiraceae bacterium]